MKTITTKDVWNTRTYEVVESVPAGFFVWNIPLDGLDGYVPLCESLRPEDKKCFSINPDTLKAIKCDDAAALVSATNYGASTPKKCRQLIARLERKQQRGKGTRYDAYRLHLCYAALPVYEKLNWTE